MNSCFPVVGQGNHFITLFIQINSTIGESLPPPPLQSSLEEWEEAGFAEASLWSTVLDMEAEAEEATEEEEEENEEHGKRENGGAR